MSDQCYSYNIKFNMTAEVVKHAPRKFGWVIKNWKGQPVAVNAIVYPEQGKAKRALEKFLFKIRHDEAPVKVKP